MISNNPDSEFLVESGMTLWQKSMHLLGAEFATLARINNTGTGMPASSH